MTFIIVVFILAFLVLAVAINHRFGGAHKIKYSAAVAGVGVLIFGSIFGYEFFHIPAPIPITSDRAILGLMVGWFSFGLLRNKQTIRNFTVTDVILFCLMGTLLLSGVLTDPTYKNNLPLSRFIFFYFFPACLYFVIKNSSLKDTELKLVIAGLVGFTGYLAITAFAETKELYFLVHPSYIYDPTVTEFLGRGRGPFQNPISNGIFLTTGLSAAILWWIHSAKSPLWLRVGLTLSIPVLLLGSYSTLTRSVWMGAALVCGMISWYFTNVKQKAILIVAGTVGILFLVTVVGSGVYSFKRDKYVTQNEMSKSALLRPIFAEIAWQMFKDRPIFGCGFGQYNREKIPYLQDPHSDLPLSHARPYVQHNVFLSLLTETGLLGCGCLMWLLGQTIWICSRIARSKHLSPWKSAFAWITLSFVCSYCVNGMFHDTSIIPMSNMLFLFLLGIVTSIYQENCVPALGAPTLASTESSFAIADPNNASWA